MTTTLSARLALVLAATTLSTQTAAQEAKACMTRAEISGLVQYVAPTAIGSTRTACAAHLAPTGFLATRGQAMIDTYTKGRTSQWPLARAAFAKFNPNGDAKSAKMMAAVPDATFQSLVDAMVPAMLTSEIKPESCRDIETMLEAMAPLAPGDMGRLVSAIFAVAVKPGKDTRGPDICAE